MDKQGADKQILAEVMGLMAASYDEPDSPLNHHEDYDLPGRTATLAILADVFDVLFPDHREHAAPSCSRSCVGGIRKKSLDCAPDPPAQRTCEPKRRPGGRRNAAALLHPGVPSCAAAGLDVGAALRRPGRQGYDEIIRSYPGSSGATIACARTAPPGRAAPARIMTDMPTRTARILQAPDRRSFFIDQPTA